MIDRDVKWVTMLPEEVKTLFKPGGNYCALVKGTNYAQLVELAIDFPQGFEAKLQGTDRLETENNFRRTLTRVNEKLRKAFKTGDPSLPFPVKIDAPESQWKKYRFMKLIAEGMTREELIRILETDAETRRKSRGRQKKGTEESKSDDTNGQYLDSLSNHLNNKLKAIHYIPRRLKLIQTDRVSTLIQHTEEEELLTEEQLLVQEDYILVIAESGMGKSTLLDKLALLSIENDRIPVYVDLKAASPPDPEDFISRIYSEAKSYQNRVDIEITDEELRNHKLLVLLDHLDMTYTKDPLKPPLEVVNINTLLTKKFAKDIKIIVCCRSNFSNYYSRLNNAFKCFELQELDADIDVPKLLADLGVDDIPLHLLDFATNPLRLTMLVEIFSSVGIEDRKHEIKSETDIYVEFINHFFVREASERHRPQVSSELKKGILSWLAYDSVTSSEGEAHELQVPWVTGHLEEIIPQVKEKLGLAPLGRNPIEEILEEGLITLSPDRKRYEFYHPSLREFFCAWHLAFNIDNAKAIDIISKKVLDKKRIIGPAWERIIIFYTGLIDDATLLINLIFNEEQNAEDIFNTNLCLIGKCLAETQYISGTLRKEIIDRLISEYFNKKENIVKNLLLESIRLIKDEKIEDQLLDKINYKDKSIQVCAIIALGKIRSHKAIQSLREILERGDDELHACASTALSQIGDDSTAFDLFELFIKRYDDDKIQEEEFDYIINFNYKAVGEYLIRELNNVNKKKKARAIKLLGFMKSKEAVRPLMSLLNDKDIEIQGITIVALAQIGSEEAIDPLINLLNDTDEDIRMAACLGLGMLSSIQSLEPLITMLDDTHDEVRNWAVRALGLIASDIATKPVAKMLDDKDSFVRGAAAESLGQIGSDGAIEALVAKVDDKSYKDKQSIIIALEKTGPLCVTLVKKLFILIEDQQEDKYIRLQAAGLLSYNGYIIATEYLVDNLNNIADWDWPTKRTIIEFLGKTGTKQIIRVVKPLIDTLEDENIFVKMESITALERIGTESAIVPLINLLKNANEDKNYLKNMILSALYEISCKTGIKITEDMIVN